MQRVASVFGERLHAEITSQCILINWLSAMAEEPRDRQSQHEVIHNLLHNFCRPTEISKEVLAFDVPSRSAPSEDPMNPWITLLHLSPLSKFPKGPARLE